MTKNLKRILIGATIFSVVIIAVYYTLKIRTKAYSPEETVTFQQDDLELEVFYNRPFKKGREIFGGLVPYEEVWRTGANEATTVETNQDILVDGSLLPAGKYTLWTIPREDSWKVIFNSEMYAWGINLDQVASREEQYDYLVIERPVDTLDSSMEQFTVEFEAQNELIVMVLAWDRTAVTVPIKRP